MGRKDKPNIDRLLAAFFLEEPDRVPVFELEVCSEIIQKIIGHPLRDVTQQVESAREAGYDPVRIHVLDSLEFCEKVGFDAVKTSLYWVPGVRRQASSSGREFVVGGTVRNKEDLENIEVPDPDDSNLYLPIEKAIEVSRDSEIGIYTSMNACWEIRHCMNSTDFYKAFYRNPSLIEELFDIYTDFYARVVHNLSQTGVDFVFITEDLCYRSGPFVNPGLLRKYVFPRYKRILSSSSVPAIFHSDGNIMPIIEDIIDVGFCAIQSLESAIVNIVEVKKKYGERICLIGNIDLRYTLPLGSQMEVAQLVKKRISQIAPGGGYVVSSENSIPEYVPVENFLSMVEATKEFGSYSTK